MDILGPRRPLFSFGTLINSGTIVYVRPESVYLLSYSFSSQTPVPYGPDPCAPRHSREDEAPRSLQRGGHESLPLPSAARPSFCRIRCRGPRAEGEGRGK